MGVHVSVEAREADETGGDALPEATSYAPQRRSWLALALTLTVQSIPLGLALWVWTPALVQIAPASDLAVFDVTSPVEPASEPEPAPPEPAPIDPPSSEVAPAPAEVAPGNLPIPQPPVPAARSTSQTPVQLPAPPPTKPAPDGKQSADWHARVLGRLNAVKAYPASARARRQQGMTMIRLVIDRAGRVIDVALERSSGFALLDREALALPSRAMPLPAPPDNVPGQRIELVVPVEFYF